MCSFRPLSGKGLSNRQLKNCSSRYKKKFSPPVGERSFKCDMEALEDIVTTLFSPPVGERSFKSLMRIHMWILTITFSPPVGERSFKLGKKNDDEKGSNPFSPPVGERSFKCPRHIRGRIFGLLFSPPVGERSFKWQLEWKEQKWHGSCFRPLSGKGLSNNCLIREFDGTIFVFAPCRGKVFQIFIVSWMIKHKSCFRPLSGKGLSN